MKAVHLGPALAVIALLVGGCSTEPTPSPADLQLPIPEQTADRNYLGLTEGAVRFRLEEIHCEVLVIDYFDMYCHICQAGAKHVNELYRLIQEQNLGPNVKMIGLGLGDTPLEVSTYRDKFKVPFPLFPDRRSAVARQFGPVRLPNLIILRKQGGSLEVVNSSPGPLLNPAQVLSHIQSTLRRDHAYHWNDTKQAAQPTCDSNSRECRNPSLPLEKTAENGVAGH